MISLEPKRRVKLTARQSVRSVLTWLHLVSTVLDNVIKLHRNIAASDVCASAKWLQWLEVVRFNIIYVCGTSLKLSFSHSKAKSTNCCSDTKCPNVQDWTLNFRAQQEVWRAQVFSSGVLLTDDYCVDIFSGSFTYMSWLSVLTVILHFF